MDVVVSSYITYLLISIALTVWVGRTLYNNGTHFLVDVFSGNKELAAAVNHLLVVGFYLINFGFVSFSLKISNPPETAQESLEVLSVKIGAVLLVLGVMHLTNIFVFNRIRIRGQEDRRRPDFPTPPQPSTQPAGPMPQFIDRPPV